MAVPRPERPYVQFNFLVSIDGGSSEGFAAGFQEVSTIGMEVTVAEYRNGNDKDNNTRKVSGLNKSSDITLKRGVIGQLDLYKWLHDIRDGRDVKGRTVVIQLQSEDHSQVVQTWILKNARIIKYNCGPLNAKGTDVAMEEMVLSYERLEME